MKLSEDMTVQELQIGARLLAEPNNMGRLNPEQVDDIIAISYEAGQKSIIKKLRSTLKESLNPH